MRQCQTDEEALLFKDEVCFALQQYRSGAILSRAAMNAPSRLALVILQGSPSSRKVMPV
jgi:hypothetical protein